VNRMAVIVLAAFCVFGMTSCGEVNSTTTIKKETKVDGDGNVKTKIETKTVETRTINSDGAVIETKDSNPIIKVGPLEVRK